VLVYKKRKIFIQIQLKINVDITVSAHGQSDIVFIKNKTWKDTIQQSSIKIVERAQSIPLTHKYMTSHFPDLVQALQ
jgi:hypothetical protein